MAAILLHAKGKKALMDIVSITRSEKHFRKAVIPGDFVEEEFSPRRQLSHANTGNTSRCCSHGS